jgi:hypothetical protein
VRACLGFNGKNQNFSQKRTLGFAMLWSFTFAINISIEKYRKTQILLKLVNIYIYVYIYIYIYIYFPVSIKKEYKGEEKYRSTHSERWH